jgi:hypothetical protein
MHPIAPPQSDKMILGIQIAHQEIRTIETYYEQKLNAAGLVESFFFNLVYVWSYFVDNALVEMTDENSRYFVAAWQVILERNHANPGGIDSFDVFKERFPKYQKELILLNEAPLAPIRPCPTYYYQKLFETPLQPDAAFPRVVGSEMLTEFFAASVNQLHDKLEEAFAR